MQCSSLGCEHKAAFLVVVIEEPKATRPDGTVVSLGGARETPRGYCASDVLGEVTRLNALPATKSGDLVVERYELVPAR